MVVSYDCRKRGQRSDSVTDIQEQVEALAGLLGCAVLVEDQRHRPLWWSAQGEVDNVRMRSILQREPPPGAAALVTRLGLPDAPGPVRTPALPDVDMAERWCVPLRRGRDLLGYLWVLDADGRVREADLDPVVACAVVAADVMARMQPPEQDRTQRRQRLLDRLLEGDADESGCQTCALWTSGWGGMTSWPGSWSRGRTAYGLSASTGAVARVRRRSRHVSPRRRVARQSSTPTTSRRSTSRSNGGRACSRRSFSR